MVNSIFEMLLMGRICVLVSCTEKVSVLYRGIPHFTIGFVLSSVLSRKAALYLSLIQIKIRGCRSVLWWNICTHQSYSGKICLWWKWLYLFTFFHRTQLDILRIRFASVYIVYPRTHFLFTLQYNNPGTEVHIQGWIQSNISVRARALQIRICPSSVILKCPPNPVSDYLEELNCVKELICLWVKLKGSQCREKVWKCRTNRTYWFI